MICLGIFWGAQAAAVGPPRMRLATEPLLVFRIHSGCHGSFLSSTEGY